MPSSWPAFGSSSLPRSRKRPLGPRSCTATTSSKRSAPRPRGWGWTRSVLRLTEGPALRARCSGRSPSASSARLEDRCWSFARRTLSCGLLATADSGQRLQTLADEAPVRELDAKCTSNLYDERYLKSGARDDGRSERSASVIAPPIKVPSAAKGRRSRLGSLRDVLARSHGSSISTRAAGAAEFDAALYDGRTAMPPA